jgi:hypothetical protein
VCLRFLDSATSEIGCIVRGRGERFLLALASKERLVSILEKMLDESEFFSEYGIRSYAQPIWSVNTRSLIGVLL